MEARATDQKYHFLMERSPTPIYERINRSFKDALEELGHKVTFFDPSQLGSFEQAVQHFWSNIASQSIDYCIVTSNSVFLESYFTEEQNYLFELLNTPIIFIHHDDISNKLSGLSHPDSIFIAYQRVKSKSIHFCLEYSNVLDLRFLGFERVHPILHGSEFKAINSSPEKPYTVSFVGHVLPKLGEALDLLPYSHVFQADFWTRLVNLDKKLKPSSVSFANQRLEQDNNLDFFEQKFFYISTLNLVSPCFRGELLTRLSTKLKCLNIDIFGGDPGYLHGLLSNRKIDKSSVRYHPSTTDSLGTQSIYANSKINLNITALQFDDAVVNRVIDVGAVGGFILTDWKPSLQSLTSVHKEISYKSIDELGDKINYYLSHDEERLKIAEKLHQDVMNKSTYSHIVKFILSSINQMPINPSQPLRVDLGCGAWKPEGFVGVDSYSWPEVDIIADLNQSFPFRDNSVDEVRAHDVIEHLPDRIHTMNEIWRICKPNAIADIRVPSTDGRGAFQDPTHVSFWNINSFKYYCVEFPDYINLCKSYGFQGAFKIISIEQEESPDRVIHVRAILQAIKLYENQSSEDIIENLSQQLSLRTINLLAFPDWSQPEELLLSDLTEVIRLLSLHPDKNQITLLINTENNFKDSEIEPELILSSILLNLSLNEGLDITEDGLAISLIQELNRIQYKALWKRIDGRILLNYEDTKNIEILQLNTIVSFKKDDIPNLRMQ